MTRRGRSSNFSRDWVCSQPRELRIASKDGYEMVTKASSPAARWTGWSPSGGGQG